MIRLPKPLRVVLSIGAALLLLALIMGVRSCQQARIAKTEAKIARERGDAGIQSGRDAVDTIGKAATRETEIHDTVKDATDAIAKAPAGDSNAAADRAACKLRSYRDQPRCRALLDARPE